MADTTRLERTRSKRDVLLTYLDPIQYCHGRRGLTLDTNKVISYIHRQDYTEHGQNLLYDAIYLAYRELNYQRLERIFTEARLYVEFTTPTHNPKPLLRIIIGRLPQASKELNYFFGDVLVKSGKRLHVEAKQQLASEDPVAWGVLLLARAILGRKYRIPTRLVENLRPKHPKLAVALSAYPTCDTMAVRRKRTTRSTTNGNTIQSS